MIVVNAWYTCNCTSHINSTRNCDLSEQCLTLQREKTSLLKDKEDAQKQIKELRQSSQSMGRKIESMANELTRWEQCNVFVYDWLKTSAKTES